MFCAMGGVEPMCTCCLVLPGVHCECDGVGEQKVFPAVDGGEGYESALVAAGVSVAIGSCVVRAGVGGNPERPEGAPRGE